MKKRRTLSDEKRSFNSNWELNYFMIETTNHTMVCLICEQVIKTIKGDNAKQHY
ncbi:hypothetical protein A3Q56_04427 [Intoshia linei]|uniref:SPIN-DOC-like zinc-finger domain-containing protein n=1 Tax=Intoshia linei TaxID=1819745 RepID=A0A177B0E5_9BILA|nr:hypothetical protein A3Q56_04427 [Intoshia linei]